MAFLSLKSPNDNDACDANCDILTRWPWRRIQRFKFVTEENLCGTTAGNPVNNSFKGEEAGCIVKEITSQTEFEQWVNEIPKRLSLLQTIVPTEIDGALDFSLHSLNVLGSWIVYTYPDYEAYCQTDHKDWTAVFGTYVGETFIKLLGGHWDINLHDDDLAYWRIPGIVGHQSPEGPYHVYPSTWITTAILRQDEEFIRNVVEAWVTGLPIKKRISK